MDRDLDPEAAMAMGRRSVFHARCLDPAGCDGSRPVLEVSAPTEPRGGEGLTVEQAMKLLPGDQLEVIAADSFLTTRGFGNGAKVTFRAFDGEYIDLADMPYTQGTGPHRFAFVSRPSPPVVHGWPDREAVARIIDPAAFLFADDEIGEKGIAFKSIAFEKADAILALRDHPLKGTGDE